MKNILMNDFKAQWSAISSKVHEAVERVGTSGWYILGKEVSHFEKELAGYFGLSHAAGVASGLDAIEIGLRVLGIKPGDKVLTTPLSAFATTLAILRCGGVPVFVDVDKSGLIDLDKAKEALKRNPDIRFFVPVHLYGHALDLNHLENLKKEYELTIVEDCAQAIGAASAGKAVGSVGQISATSFYPTKNLGCLGDGGALLTNSEKYAVKARTLRDYGQSGKYIHSEFGLNSRLDEVQAAILSHALLPFLKDWTQRRREIARQYNKGIHNPHVLIPSCPSHSDSVWHLFPVLVKERESFQQYLTQHGIMTGIHYPRLIPDQEALLNTVRPQKIGDMKNSSMFANEEVSLPIHPFLSDEDVSRVINKINLWSSK